MLGCQPCPELQIGLNYRETVQGWTGTYRLNWTPLEQHTYAPCQSVLPFSVLLDLTMYPNGSGGSSLFIYDLAGEKQIMQPYLFGYGQWP